jgi:hypothetical protein
MSDDKQKEIKSLLLHPGWQHCLNYIMSTQTMKLNEIEKPGATTEDICKALGGLSALRRFAGWVESTAKAEPSA